MFRAWSSPEAVFEIIKHLSAGRPCDIAGIRDYRHLDAAGGIQWPYTPELAATGEAESAATPSQRRLFTDGRYYHPDGKARLHFDAPRPLPEEPNAKFPFLLITGRGTVAQWHTQTRTAKSAVLRKLYSASPIVEINPADARQLSIRPGNMVWIVSQRGRIQAKAVLNPCVQPGQLFIPMHYEVTNILTHPAFDPHSSQPAYKACAVNVEWSA
jgi:assimilatory nitrate reductase catalytic subunit